MRMLRWIGVVLCLVLAGCSGKKPKVEPPPATEPLPPTDARPTTSRPVDDGLTYKGKHLRAWVKALEEPDPDTRVQAAEAIAHLGDKAKGAAPGLAGLLKDRIGIVRMAGAKALVALGPEARDAVPALTDAFRDDSNKGVRVQAGNALMNVGPGARSAIPTFVKALDDPDPDLRLEAVLALPILDPQDKAVHAALIKALRDPVSTVGDKAAAILAQMGEPVVADLTDAVKGADVTAATRAAVALAHIGPKAKSAVPTLGNTLKITPRENHLLRWKIAEALVAMGPAAKPAASSLIDALRSDDYRVRHSAQDALIALQPDGGLVPELIAVMKEENGNGLLDASKVLAKIGKPAVPALVDLLSSTNSNLLLPTIYALDEIGPDARAAVVKLGFLLNEDDDMVKKAVRRALKDIDPEEAARRGVK